MIIFYILTGIICVVAIIYIVGLCLPAGRIVSREGCFNVPPETLYTIVTDNTNWQYRSSLRDLIIHSSENGMEVWDEINKDGSIIRFHTEKKVPFNFYSFSMESKLFTGNWNSRFESDENGNTLFTATEHIRVKNPFVKTLSYIFFDVGKLMDQYQQDLQKKVRTLNRTEAANNRKE